MSEHARRARDLEALIEIANREIADYSRGGRKPSVAAIAKRAGMSRQAIYSSHPSVVEMVRASRTGSAHPRVGSSAAEGLIIKKRLAAEARKVRILTTLVVELMAELEDTRSRMQDEIDKLNHKWQLRTGANAIS